VDILDTTVSDGAFWEKCVLAYDKAQSGELVCRTANGIDKIGNRLILPCLLAGQSWGYPSVCKVSAIGDKKEDEAKPAIDALASHLLKITDHSFCSVATLASDTTSPGDSNGLDLDSIATPTSSILRKRGTTESELPPKDTPLNSRLNDRAKLANLGWDHTAETPPPHAHQERQVDLLQPRQG